MSARSKIADKLVEKIKEIDGTGDWVSDLHNNVEKKLKFFDEVNDYPTALVNVGTEMREYLPGGFKWGYLQVNLRIYVEDDDPEARLEEIFEDLETVVDANMHLEYETDKFIEDMKILSITTDEGLLHPKGVGEITLQVQYGLDGPCY